MAVLDDLADRIDSALGTFEALAPAVFRGEPWPLTDVYEPGPESTWGPRELLAHCAEMIPFWSGAIELILAAAEPPEFGRTEADPLRVQIIGRDRGFPARELLARVQGEGARVARRLRELAEDEAGRVGRHATRGEMSVRELAESYIVRHLEGHAQQLRETLAAAR